MVDDVSGKVTATPRVIGGMSMTVVRMDRSLVIHTLAPVSAIEHGEEFKQRVD